MSQKRKIEDLENPEDYRYKVEASVFEVKRTSLLDRAIDKLAELKATSETPESDFKVVWRPQIRDTERDFMALQDRKRQLMLQKNNLERELALPPSPLAPYDDLISFHEKSIKYLLICKAIDPSSSATTTAEEEELKDVLFPPPVITSATSTPAPAPSSSGGILSFFSSHK